MTGTASPRIQTESAVSTTVRKRRPPASSTIRSAIFSPKPVRVKMPTMIPAVAVVAATERVPFAPASSARSVRRGVRAVSRRRKLSRKPRTVA